MEITHEHARFDPTLRKAYDEYLVRVSESRCEKYRVTFGPQPGFQHHLPSCSTETVIAAAEIVLHSESHLSEDPLARAVDATTDQTTDHVLMLAVRDGDLDALGELFERHHGPLFGFLFKLTGYRTAAEDITQVVFQRMLKYRHTYRNDGSFTAWMYHLARRCSSDHFRKMNSAPRATDPSTLYQHADEAPHAAQDATRHDDHALLHTALAQLDHEDREVLLLSRFEELSFAEISGLLECSVGAAKVRAHRALQQLRTIYLRLQKQSVS